MLPAESWRVTARRPGATYPAFPGKRTWMRHWLAEWATWLANCKISPPSGGGQSHFSLGEKLRHAHSVDRTGPVPGSWVEHMGDGAKKEAVWVLPSDLTIARVFRQFLHWEKVGQATPAPAFRRVTSLGNHSLPTGGGESGLPNLSISTGGGGPGPTIFPLPTGGGGSGWGGKSVTSHSRSGYPAANHLATQSPIIGCFVGKTKPGGCEYHVWKPNRWNEKRENSKLEAIGG